NNNNNNNNNNNDNALLATYTEKISRLEKENNTLTSQIYMEEQKRKNSNAQVSATMFQKILLLEQDKELEKKRYEEQIEQLRQQLNEITVSAPRRASELHRSMFQSLLDAEADYNTAKFEWRHKESLLDNQQTQLKGELEQLKQEHHKHLQQCTQSISSLQSQHQVQLDHHESTMKLILVPSQILFRYKHNNTFLSIGKTKIKTIISAGNLFLDTKEIVTLLLLV
ncbi:hypothetical protein RFI_08182, partial [Reticulomyxa filosa]